MLLSVATVVKLLIDPTLFAIHRDSLIAPGRHDATPRPAQGVRRARMGADLALRFAGAFVLEEEADD